MSKHGLHVDDFPKWRETQHKQEYVLHQARCGKLKPSKTCLQTLFDTLEIERSGGGWRYSYFPLERRSDWKSDSDDWSEIDEKYGNAAICEIARRYGPSKNRLQKGYSLQNTEVHSKIFMPRFGSEADVYTRGLNRPISGKKGAPLTKNDKDNSNASLSSQEAASKQRLTIQSLNVDKSEVRMAETEEKVARDQRYFNQRLREISRPLPPKDTAMIVSKSCPSEKSTGPGNREQDRTNRDLPARRRRRSSAGATSSNKLSLKSSLKNTSKYGNKFFTSPVKVFEGFTIYGDQSIQLQPTFPESFKNDDPPEFRALASQKLRLDIKFDQIKADQAEQDFPYQMIIQERRIHKNTCTSSLAFHPVVKSFSSDRLEVEGTMSCIHSDTAVQFSLKVFPETTATGRVRYTGTYRRQMKPGSQYMTWKFKV